MPDKKNIEKQIHDIVELNDQMLALSDIELIATSDRVRRKYEKKYKGRLGAGDDRRLQYGRRSLLGNPAATYSIYTLYLIYLPNLIC